MSNIKADIKELCSLDHKDKQQLKSKKNNKTEPQEHKTFIIYNPLKPLPKIINKELRTNKEQKVELFYNDANEILEHLQNNEFIQHFKRDVEHIYNLYNNYYNDVFRKVENKTEIPNLKMFVYEQIKQLKLDKKQNIPNEFDKIEQDIHDILLRYQSPNKTKIFTEYFHHKLMKEVFKQSVKDTTKNTTKNIIKFKSFNELMNIYKNTEATIIINTLSKDFNIDEIKDIINYGTTYKHIWLIVDYLTYKLINVEGCEIIKNKSYVIKF